MRIKFDRTTILIYVSIMAIVTTLTLFAKNESATNKAAINALVTSPEVRNRVGPVRYTILVGTKYAAMNRDECSSFNYIVIGAQSFSWITVRLRNKIGDTPVVDISTGYFSSNSHWC